MARWWRNYSSVLHTIYSIQWLYLWAYVQNISHLLRSQSLIKQFKAISNILRDNIYVRQDRTFTCFPNPTHRCKPMIYVCKLIKEKWIFPGCADSQSDPSWIIEFFNGHTERFTFFFVIKLWKRHNLKTQPPRNLTTNMSLLSICWTVLVAKCCLNIGWQFPCGNSKPYIYIFFFYIFFFVTELRLFDGLHPFNITSVTSQISIRVLCYLCTSLLEFGSRSPSHILTIVKH